jgi:hypothetical protein
VHLFLYVFSPSPSKAQYSIAKDPEVEREKRMSESLDDSDFKSSRAKMYNYGCRWVDPAIKIAMELLELERERRDLLVNNRIKK